MGKKLTNKEKQLLRTKLDINAVQSINGLTKMIDAANEVGDTSSALKLKQALLQLHVAYSRLRLKL